jgi:hypothetical protein
MIWDRDYMKERRDDPNEVAEAEPSSQKLAPFNLFGGITSEPLAPGQPLSEPAPKAKQPEAQPPMPTATAEKPGRTVWIIAAIAIAALIVGLLIGLQFAR